MKALPLAGAASFCLAASQLCAPAEQIEFNNTGNLANFTVSSAGPYQIFAVGGEAEAVLSPALSAQAVKAPRSTGTSV
jgi:hypothetical protein